MKTTTYSMIKLALDADDTIVDAERKAIVAFCREPVLPVSGEAAPAQPAERWLSPSQAAAVLSVSLRTIQRLVVSGTLPSRKVLGCRRISASVLASAALASKASPEMPQRGRKIEWASRKPTAAGYSGQTNTTKAVG